jgi:hypothetical protein
VRYCHTELSSRLTRLGKRRHTEVGVGLRCSANALPIATTKNPMQTVKRFEVAGGHPFRSIGLGWDNLANAPWSTNAGLLGEQDWIFTGNV